MSRMTEQTQVQICSKGQRFIYTQKTPSDYVQNVREIHGASRVHGVLWAGIPLSSLLFSHATLHTPLRSSPLCPLSQHAGIKKSEFTQQKCLLNLFLPCLTTHTFAEHVHSFSKAVIITSFNFINEFFHQLPSGQRVSNFQKQEHSFSFSPSSFCPSVFNLVTHKHPSSPHNRGT